MQIAIIDIGSNSVHLKIYHIRGKKHHTLLHQKVSAGLINFRENNLLSKDGIRQLVRVLRDYKSISDLVGVQGLFAFATASLRNIANQDRVVEIVREKTGIAIDVISGYVESNLGFIGMQDAFEAAAGITIDMGGGSTEFLKFQEHEIEQVTSLPFGALSLYKSNVQLVLPTREEIKKIRSYVKKELKALPWLSTDTLYLSGGTAKAFARIHLELQGSEGEVHGHTMEVTEYKSFYKQLIEDKPATAKLLTKLAPERVHTLLPGMVAYKTVFQASGCKKIVISEAGVREGYLCKKILPKLAPNT